LTIAGAIGWIVKRETKLVTDACTEHNRWATNWVMCQKKWKRQQYQLELLNQEKTLKDKKPFIPTNKMVATQISKTQFPHCVTPAGNHGSCATKEVQDEFTRESYSKKQTWG